MDDREFFDKLYQSWSKTSGAENTFWMPEENESFPGTYLLVATDSGDKRIHVADFLNETDGDFIASVHGALPEIVRRVLDAIDESDRLDAEKDDLHVRIAELEMEADALQARIAELEMDLNYWSNR
jgi:hypothetical protein